MSRLKVVAILVLWSCTSNDGQGPWVGECGPSNCTGCCTSGVCFTPMLQSWAECGTGGDACVACGGDSICQAGACVPPSGSPGSDAGITVDAVAPDAPVDAGGGH